MYTFSEKRPRAVASAPEISYDRGKGGDGVIEILEQTPGLVVCIKPVGVRAQGEAEADLPALLKRQLGCEIYPVHRLDQAVGGVMVFAKTAPAAAKPRFLTALWQRRTGCAWSMSGCIPEGRTRFVCSSPRAACRLWETENTEAGKMQLRPLCGPTR